LKNQYVAEREGNRDKVHAHRAENARESESIDAEEIIGASGSISRKLDELLRARVRRWEGVGENVSVGLGRERETVTVKNRGGSHLRIDGRFRNQDGRWLRHNRDFDSLERRISTRNIRAAHESLVMEVRPIRSSGGFRRLGGQAASKVFMLTSVEDERAALSLPEAERTKIMRQHQGVAANTSRVARLLDQEPGVVGRRAGWKFRSSETIRWKMAGDGDGRTVRRRPKEVCRRLQPGCVRVDGRKRSVATSWHRATGDAIEVRRSGMLVDLSRMSRRARAARPHYPF